MSNNKRWIQYTPDNTSSRSLSLPTNPLQISVNNSRKVKKEQKQTILNCSSSSNNFIMQPSLDKVLISMLTYKDGSWKPTTHKWEYHPSECKEVIHCCIDELGTNNNQIVKIGFDLWNFYDVDVIAFFNIDGQEMKKSLCPIVRANGQTFRATAFFEETDWHSICIKQSDLAEDPDDIDFEKLNSAGKIIVKVFKFAFETVLSDSNIEYDQTNTKLNGVKCKLNSDKGEISVTKGEKIENANVTVRGYPDCSQLLKVFEINYHTPGKYQMLTSNKKLNENRSMPTPGGNNMFSLATTRTAQQSNPGTPGSGSQAGSSTSHTPQPVVSEQPTITPLIATNTVTQATTSTIPSTPLTVATAAITSPTLQTSNSPTPSKDTPSMKQATLDKLQPKRKEIEVIVLDSDDEDDLDNSEQSGCDSKVIEPEPKKLKPSTSQTQTVPSLFKPLKKDVSMEEVCAKYSLVEVQTMTCEQLEEFISKALGSKKYQFDLSIFEMNGIDGNVYITNFSELSEMGLEKELIQEMEKILNILK
ncbi:predicted protein [Naegleria gruberi]|uniref:Predicted protein n=1 Tax=Naegleria gruberi TaxID=5762 RepID=D2VLY1_NAEGR|nr:uncharacterized protein NAEGRDRAFT_50651 [Naegleria gruberi]EFC42132.1 predicted protein [Naegleria gruberi]|eukprot:XP_002674876.1 predicted protein [Naegleria gruberi strain NEG-M]